MMKGKSCQPKVLYPAKMLFKEWKGNHKIVTWVKNKSLSPEGLS